MIQQARSGAGTQNHRCKCYCRRSRDRRRSREPVVSDLLDNGTGPFVLSIHTADVVDIRHRAFCAYTYMLRYMRRILDEGSCRQARLFPCLDLSKIYDHTSESCWRGRPRNSIGGSIYSRTLYLSLQAIYLVWITGKYGSSRQLRADAYDIGTTRWLYWNGQDPIDDTDLVDIQIQQVQVRKASGTCQRCRWGRGLLMSTY